MYVGLCVCVYLFDLYITGLHFPVVLSYSEFVLLTNPARTSVSRYVWKVSSLTPQVYSNRDKSSRRVIPSLPFICACRSLNRCLRLSVVPISIKLIGELV
jgi:hypothetical protein